MRGCPGTLAQLGWTQTKLSRVTRVSELVTSIPALAVTGVRLFAAPAYAVEDCARASAQRGTCLVPLPRPYRVHQKKPVGTPALTYPANPHPGAV